MAKLNGTFLELSYVSPADFEKIFNQFPTIVGLPSYYTIIDGQFKVWPSVCKDNQIPILAWRFPNDNPDS